MIFSFVFSVVWATLNSALSLERLPTMLAGSRSCASTAAQDVNLHGDMEECGSAHARVTHVSGRIDSFSMAPAS